MFGSSMDLFQIKLVDILPNDGNLRPNIFSLVWGWETQLWRSVEYFEDCVELNVDVYGDRPTAVPQLLSANKFLHSSPIKGQIFIEVNIMYGQSSWVWYITQNEGFIKALMKDAFTAGCLPSLWRSGERRRLTLTSPQAHKLLLKRTHAYTPWVHLWASLYSHILLILYQRSCLFTEQTSPRYKSFLFGLRVTVDSLCFSLK